MSYVQNFGKTRLFPHQFTDVPEWVGRDGIEVEIIADSAVNGGGCRLMAELDGYRQAVVSGLDKVSHFIGSSHPAVVASRDATSSAISEQGHVGRAIGQMARDDRKLGK